MSTKIYGAWKTRRPNIDVFQLARGLYAKARPRVEHVIREMVLQKACVFDKDSKPVADWVRSGVAEPLARIMAASEYLTDEYYKQLGSRERGVYDLSVYMHFWEKDGFYYLRQYGDMKMSEVWDFVSEEPDLIDYEYWNNTDQPDGISYEEWSERGDEWDDVLKDRANMTLSVLDQYSLTEVESIFPYNPMIREHMEAILPQYLAQQRYLNSAMELHAIPGMTEDRYCRRFCEMMTKAGHPCGPGMARFMWRTIREAEAKREAASNDIASS